MSVVVCVFFSFLLLLFACLPEVPAEPTTPAPQPDIPLAEKSEKTPELPAPIAEAVTENRTVASPGVPTPVAAVHGQSRTEAEQASGTVEAVVLRRKSKPPQRTLNSIPDEDGFEEEELPGESAAAVPVFSYLLTPVYYTPVSLLPSHFYTNPQHILGQEIQFLSYFVIKYYMSLLICVHLSTGDLGKFLHLNAKRRYGVEACAFVSLYQTLS